MNKIGIMGGSFDPIHLGHLILAEQARVEAELSEVVFMPAFVSPFKQNTKAAGPEDRLEMVKLATAGNPFFSVSSLEIRSGRVSYTSQTLRRCRRELEPESELWFITGTDAFLNIEEWHEADYLLSNFSFAIGLRPGFPEEALDRLIRRIFHRYGTRVKKICSTQVDISSSLIRDLAGEGKSARYLVPGAVLDYINEKGLYREARLVKEKPEKGKDRLDSGEERRSVRSRVWAYLKENLKESRLVHTQGVALEALALARRYGGDEEKAELCALFHDSRRDAGDLEHGRLAAELMKREYGIADEDMLNAVIWHTTGRADMSLLEKVIYLADAIEPSRSYPGVEELRRLAYQDLDGACLMAMENSIRYVQERGLALDGNTVKAREFLKKRRRYG